MAEIKRIERKFVKREIVKAIKDYFTKNDIILVEDFTRNQDGEIIEDLSLKSQNIIAYCDNELELFDKKASSRGNSKASKENIKLKEILLEELAKCEKPVTITDLMNQSEIIKNYICENGNPLSNQKISALFKIMLETDKTIDKIVDKKKSYFTVI